MLSFDLVLLPLPRASERISVSGGVKRDLSAEIDGSGSASRGTFRRISRSGPCNSRVSECPPPPAQAPVFSTLSETSCLFPSGITRAAIPLRIHESDVAGVRADKCLCCMASWEFMVEGISGH